MDAARQGYHSVYGGSPGLTWLFAGFSGAMEAAGLDAAARRTVFIENPARSLAFVPGIEGASR
jgi:predicted metal-dependent phosphotriesterase family hydrolase